MEDESPTLKFQHRFKINNTQQEDIHLKLFWPKSTILTSKSAKYENVQKFVTVKIVSLKIKTDSVKIGL